MDIFDQIITNHNARILEIGPLCNPQIKRERFPNVYYGDINSTQKIIELYGKHPNVDIDKVVNIDYILTDGYEAVFKNEEKFDYFVASHVVEHVPDIIHFFHDITNVLSPHSKVLIFYPDKRYCFDHFRNSSSFSEAYDVYCRGISENASAVLDYNLNVSEIINADFWWNDVDLHKALNERPFEVVLAEYKEAFNGNFPLYLNFHYWIFSDESFLLFLNNFVRAKLFPFSLKRIIPTVRNENQFFVEFEYIPEIIKDPTSEISNLKSIMSDFLATRHQSINELYEKLSKDYAALFADHQRIIELSKRQSEDYAKLYADNQSISELNKRQTEDYAAILNSISWHLTKPLRSIVVFVKKMVKL